MSRPRISVVIPTRERADVLAVALRTVTEQNYDELEILVSDNCSQDTTAEVVQAANDRRIRYLTTGRRVSMAENWEFAMSQVTGTWVTVMGDDDGLVPGALARVAELVAGTQVQAIRSRVGYYSWPSPDAEPFGKLVVPLQIGSEIRDSDSWLTRVLLGRASYFELPMIYNGGFIRAGVLAALRSGTGRVFRSFAPDVYAAVAVASVVPSYLFSHEPLAVNGASVHSHGRSFFSTTPATNGRARELFAAEANLPLHPDIPYGTDGRYPMSIQAMVYEAYLQSAFLRDQPARTGRAEQLAVILATSGKHRVAVEAWSEIFARQHGIDLREAKVRARVLAARLFIDGLPQRVLDAVNRQIVGSHDLPIRNVEEACRAVAAIRGDLPGSLTRTFRAAKRLVSS